MGKSSIVRAGLVPALRQSREQVWEVITIMPTDRPMRALAAGLIPYLEPELSELNRLKAINSLTDDKLLKDPTQQPIQLRDVVERVLEKQPGTDRLLLIVDQWEELYTLCQDARASRCFVDQMLAATKTGNLHVVLTLRGDFYSRAITAHRLLSDRVQEAQVNVGPMTREELRLAIEEPAKLAGLTFETGLVDLLLEQAGDEPGNLLLLEFVLRQLWEHRRGGELHHEAYQAMGQLEGAIAKKAESLYRAASEEDRQRIQQILLRLVRPGEGEADTRRRATLTELGERLQPLVKTLADERLLVTSQVSGSAEETVEVSHEALIRQWGLLKEWVEQDRQFLVWQQRLSMAIKEWKRNGQSAGLLLRGQPLAEARERLKNKPGACSLDEQQFIHISRRAKYLRLMAMVLPLLVVGVMGVWLFQSELTLHQALLTARSKVMSIHQEPEMVRIPGGTFAQGDVEGVGHADEQPLRDVTVPEFLLGKFEVTFEEYQRYTIAMGKDLPNDENWGEGQRPVINVSWDDAKAYAQWLSEATGKPYRLSTESEWEYVARSGDKQETWAGTSEESELVNYAVFGAIKTVEVGSKQRNEFWIYDLSGNVWEWVEDCWHDNYNGAPTDGAAWLEAGGAICTQRVIRGGAWGNGPGTIRSSDRDRGSPVNLNDFIGFRLAQDIR